MPYQFRALCLEEIYALRQAITPDEKNRLCFWALRPGDKSRDILGQISAGNLARWSEIVAQCVVPFTDYSKLPNPNPFSKNRPYLNFEIYMAQPWAENQRIVRFLRGEVQDLTVDDL